MTWNSETDDGERNVGPFPEDILTEEENGKGGFVLPLRFPISFVINVLYHAVPISEATTGPYLFVLAALVCIQLFAWFVTFVMSMLLMLLLIEEVCVDAFSFEIQSSCWIFWDASQFVREWFFSQDCTDGRGFLVV